MTSTIMPELWVLLRVLLAVVVVLALAVVVLRWLLPRFGTSFGLAGRGTVKRLDVVEVQALDRDHRLALIEIAGNAGPREVLMAFGGGSATLLDCWPAPPADGAPEETTP